MSESISDHDPAEALETEEAIAAFLDDALKTEDAPYIKAAIEVAAPAKRLIDTTKSPVG